MVRVGSTGGHQFIPNLLGEGDVDQPVAVNVTQLSPAQAILGPPKTVRVGRNPLPTQHCFGDLLDIIGNR